MVISIFELEKRTNFKQECLKIEDYLLRYKYIIPKDGYVHTFWDLVDYCFEAWPYRYTATTWQEFFSLIKLKEKVDYMMEDEYFYYLQFIYEFISWLITAADYYRYHNKEDVYTIEKIVEKNYLSFRTIVQNIQLIAELMNYKIEKIDSHYTFIKRDADVDSILPSLENEEDLKIALLEYNDFRIENNKEEKKIILKKIGDYLEPCRKEFSSLNKSLTDDVFFMLNNFYIRHNNDKNIKFDTDEEYILWYDNLFMMMIQLIRTKNIKEIQNKLKEFKKKA